MTKLARNEQRKLTATLLNGLAVAFVGVGVLSPTIALVNGTAPSGVTLVIVVVACALTGFALHFAGRQVLATLEE